MTKAIIFTLVSDLTLPGFLRMKQSCEAWGWTVDAHPHPWRGDIQRWSVFKEQLSRYRNEGYTHALALDALDVVALGPPDQLRPKLAFYNDPAVLIAAEGAPWPNNYRAAEYPERRHLFWYAHSQIVVDLRQELPARFLDFHHDHDCDQQHFADLILDKVPGVAIDRQCQVVQSLAHAHPWQYYFDAQGERFRNRITGSYPLFAHGNGGAPMDWIRAELLHPLPHAVVNDVA